MVAALPQCEPDPEWPHQVKTNCPDCAAELAVLRIIPGRTVEYWTMLCIGCGGIHLYVVEPRA